MVFAGCTSEDISNTPTEKRLPLRLEATLSAGSPVTRAVDNTIEPNDELLSFVRHVYTTSNIKAEADYSKYAKVQGGLVKFTTATSGTALYWDDFSKSDSKENDLRTENHGLQSYYGYCYNGGAPSSTLVEDTGVLGWTTDEDQSTEGDMKKNDLLWSLSQKAIEYNHAKDKHGTLTVPYTHAMSKFTIVIVAGDGFVAGDLNAATVTLNGMNLKGEFTAPKASVTATGTTTVKMFANTASTTTDNKPCRAYEAVTVPTTELTTGKLLATIENMGGNTYDVNVSADMLTSWYTGLEGSNTKSGVNYKLTVTLNKQAVGVVATLAGWNDVSATGDGKINFSADVTDCGISNSLKANDNFTLWRAVKGDNELADTDFKESTTVSYNGTAFKYSTVFYWPNKDDSYYFRALATMTGNAISAVTDKTVNQGTDLLWGTTAAHGNYGESAAIAPRTGDVPLAFKHAMSNVVITLLTKENDKDPAYVDLSKATFELTNLAKTGTIALTDGKITPAATEAVAFSDGESGVARIMVPQDLGNAAKLIINLNDYTTDPANTTTYSLMLNGVGGITKWESGNQYNYTINITKEEMKFLVQIKNWTPTDGSGDATLDW